MLTKIFSNQSKHNKSVGNWIRKINVNSAGRHKQASLRPKTYFWAICQQPVEYKHCLKMSYFNTKKTANLEVVLTLNRQLPINVRVFIHKHLFLYTIM